MGVARNIRTVTRAARIAVAGVWFVAALGTGCSPPQTAAPAAATAAVGFAFVDVAAAAGITRASHAGRPGKDHLLDSAGCGLAWIDFDGDGWIDLYVLDGWSIQAGAVSERGRNTLYRNRRDGTFEDVTEQAHVGGEGRWCNGVAVGDFDGDGRPDLFVTTFGANLLYRNRGDGTFEDVAERAGVTIPRWNTGAVFFDADGDGRLDLYVAAYIDCTLESVLSAQRTLDWKGVEKVAVGPFGLAGAPDHFLHNDGDGRFSDRTKAQGFTDAALAFGFAAGATDLDQDGDVDLYVANDSDPNYLFRNRGGGTFEEVGLWTGAALDHNGAAQAGMGLTFGDADGDGIVDVFVTNFADDASTLYRGTGKGFFEDVSAAVGIAAATFHPMSWGTTFADFDCDADLDLVVANGHIYPQVDLHPDKGATYLQPPTLLENDGSGKFADASSRAGPGFRVARCSRGLAAGDYDNDGDLDVAISNLDAPPTLLRNDSPHGAWLTIVCAAEGKAPPVGTVVEVVAGGRRQRREVLSSDSYLSAPDPRLHFGIGAATIADEVVVRWPDGTLTNLTRVAVNRFLRVVRP